ncbi:MAG: peptidylprolyl isomerase [Verrucomicrobiota bacterium]
MNIQTFLPLLTAALLIAPLQPAGFAADTTSTVTLRVDVHGTTRDIVIELDEKNAPKTSANFKKLAAQGFYDGIAFHRVIPNYIVQAGDPLTKDASQKALWGTGGPGYTIQAELGLPHNRGSIAMARLGDASNPNKSSSGSQFYIALARLPKLDREYTVFGKVISGLEYLDQISKSATDSNNNPSERIEIVVSSATGGVAPSTSNTPAVASSSPTPAPPSKKADSAPKMDKTSSTASAEPEKKKKSWLKRKFSKKDKNSEKMAAADVDESTPAPTPAAAPAPSPASKSSKKAATKPLAQGSPAAANDSNVSNTGSDGAPSYRNDNKVDSRSAMIGSSDPAGTASSSNSAGDASGSESLANQMKVSTPKGDVDVREEKERGLIGRFLYRYW